MPDFPPFFRALLDTLTPASYAALIYSTAGYSYEELENLKVETIGVAKPDVENFIFREDVEINDTPSLMMMDELSRVDLFDRNATREEVADLPLEDGILSIDDALLGGMQIYTTPAARRNLTEAEIHNHNAAHARQAALYRAGLEEMHSSADNEYESGTPSIADWIAATDYDSTDLLNPSEALAELTTQDRIKMDSLRARQLNRPHGVPQKRIFRHQNR